MSVRATAQALKTNGARLTAAEDRDASRARETPRRAPTSTSSSARWANTTTFSSKCAKISKPNSDSTFGKYSDVRRVYQTLAVNCVIIQTNKQTNERASIVTISTLAPPGET